MPLHHAPQYAPTPHAWRQRPAEFLSFPQFGTKFWMQNGKVRKNVKPHYHFVWPKDKDRGTFGRMKDIMTGKGPDIHLTISADKMDYMHNRQRKSRWSNWTDLDDRGPDPYSFEGPRWVRGRDDRKKYDFFTRKYETPHEYMWSDAIWQGPNKDTRYADQWRDVDGSWFEDKRWYPSLV